ncbi:MAG: DUF3630 family protein [Ferrimonas sp.]
MAKNTQLLLQQLSLQPPRSEQLLWHCPLAQEQVLALVPMLLQGLDCHACAPEQGADRLYWSVEFEGVALSLHFEGVCDSLWLQGPDPEIQFLRTLAQALTPC